MSTKLYEIQQLTPSQVDFIKASVPVLEKDGVKITSLMYNYMLSTYDEVKPYFNETDQKLLLQPKILAFALLSYAKNIEDLTPLQAFVKQIVVKHVGLRVRPEHYPIVGTCVLHALKETLGDAATDDLLDAWAAAYGNLAQILIDAEQDAYKKTAWDDFRSFRVTKIEDECEDVKSIYFTPEDGKKPVLPQRGQYVCIRWMLPNAEFERSREYSVSNHPENGEYRISVRRLEGGKVSNYIHNDLKVGDTIRVAAPCGQFTYDSLNEDREILAFVGGIGITPLLSVLEYALENGRKVKMFYSNRKVNSTAFRKTLATWKEKYPETFTLHEFVSQGKEVADAIDVQNIRQLTPEDFGFLDGSVSYDIYLLGPRGYMRFVKQNLLSKGVDEPSIKSEFFGPYEA